MKPLPLIRLSTLALALAALGPPAAWAQDPSHADHVMVVPADLKLAVSLMKRYGGGVVKGLPRFQLNLLSRRSAEKRER